jgi:hypothetical protein
MNNNKIKNIEQIISPLRNKNPYKIDINNQPLINTNINIQPLLHNKPVEKLVFCDDIPKIVDHRIKHIEDIPNGVPKKYIKGGDKPNLYNHNHLNPKPVLPDVNKINHNNNIINRQKMNEHLIFDDANDNKLTGLDDTDRFI